MSNLILLVPSPDIKTLSPFLFVITLASFPNQFFISFAKLVTLLGTLPVPLITTLPAVIATPLYRTAATPPETTSINASKYGSLGHPFLSSK